MSETLIVALISAGATLIVTVVTLFTNAFIEKYRRKLEIQQKMFQSKRENLNDVYKTLISIINLYPKSSPNDILKYVEYAPNYSMESFDSLIDSLDYQLEEYRKQLNIENIDSQRKYDIETQISNRVYSKKEILKIRDMYFNAKDKYADFCKYDKVAFDLYAGQDVRNYLVQFEVMVHNIFISGHSVGTDADDPLNNCVEICRRELINSIRSDVGIN